MSENTSATRAVGMIDDSNSIETRSSKRGSGRARAMMMERGLRGDERAAVPVRLCHWHIQNGKAQTDSTV